MLRGLPAAARQLEPGEAAALVASPPKLVRVDVVEYALLVGGAAAARAGAAASPPFAPVPEGGGWWLKRRAGALLPPLARGDEGVREALAAMGWPSEADNGGDQGADEDALAAAEDPTPALARMLPLRDRPGAAAWLAVALAAAARWRRRRGE
jgi:hypothetical protein